MTDFEELARQPQPGYTHVAATSYDRESHNGGDAWFANHDVGQYVGTETRDGRTERVMADLAGPGAVTFPRHALTRAQDARVTRPRAAPDQVTRSC